MTLSFYRHFFFCLLGFALLALGLPTQADLLPEHVLVVYRADSEHSKDCALAYAKLRNIPERNIVALKIPFPLSQRDITQEEFDAELRFPLRTVARERNLHLAGAKRVSLYPIYALCLMPDLPLRIKATPPLAGKPAPAWQKTDAASVDSELALLGQDYYAKAGMQANNYFKVKDSLPQSGTSSLVVCRLDSPDRAVTQRMINRPYEVEKSGGLKGRLVVDWGGPHAQGDTWLCSIATQALALKQPFVIHPLKSSLEAGYPMPSMTGLYFGWYETNACGPFVSPFEFMPGSVAVHIHSFSATQACSPTKGWVGPLLMRGADVTAGNTWEPYLGGSLYLDIFYEALVEGRCVAEAAGRATPCYSWQGMILGDPLYKPFPQGVGQLNDAETQANAYFIQGQYEQAAQAFAAWQAVAPSEAAAMRAQLGRIQALILAKKMEEAQRSLELILFKYSDSALSLPAKAMKSRYFPDKVEKK